MHFISLLMNDMNSNPQQSFRNGINNQIIDHPYNILKGKNSSILMNVKLQTDKDKLQASSSINININKETENEKVLCPHCQRTATNGIKCKGICVADNDY